MATLFFEQVARVVGHEHEHQPRQNRPEAVPCRTVDVPGLRQPAKSLILDAPAAPIEAAHFHSVPPRRQAADVIGARDVLALLIPDRRAVGVGLNGPYYIHRDLPMRSSFVTDPGDRLQRCHAHLLRLLASGELDRKSTRLNSSHSQISYAVFCLKKKKNKREPP